MSRDLQIYYWLSLVPGLFYLARSGGRGALQDVLPVLLVQEHLSELPLLVRICEVGRAIAIFPRAS